MDKYAKVEKLLSNYKMMEISIVNLEKEIEYLKNEDGLKGVSCEGISSSPTNVTSDIVANTVISKSEKIYYAERTIKKHVKDIERINRALEGLEETERIIIIERYINNKQWWQVANTVKYNDRWCRKKRTDAINKLVLGIYG